MGSTRVSVGAAREFGRGIDSLAQSFAMAPILRDKMQREQAGTMADMAYRRAQIGKLQAETENEAARGPALNALPAQMAGLTDPQADTLAGYFANGQFGEGIPNQSAETPPWATPEVLDRYNRGRMVAGATRAAGSSTPESIAKAFEMYSQVGDREAVMRGGLDPTAAAQGYYATSGKAPFISGDSGQVINQGTGEEMPYGELTLSQIAKNQRDSGTTLMQNLEAAGLQPGTPEYQQAIMGSVNKGGVQITGYDDAGRPLISVGGSGGSLGTAATNEVEKKVLSTGDTLSQLTAIRSRYRPEFQEIGTRAGKAFSSFKARLSGGDALDPEEEESLREYGKYRAEAGQLFSLVLKDLSGAAVTPPEMKRAEAWLPNPGTGLLDGDDPVTLQAKLERFEDFTRKALMKYAYVQRNGLSINDIDVDQMPQVMNQRGDEIAAELQGQGVSGDALKNAVKQRLADEFGLVAY